MDSIAGNIVVMSVKERGGSDHAGNVTDSATSAPRQFGTHWRFSHTAAIIALSGFVVWMGLARPWEMYGSWVIATLGLTLFTLIVGQGLTGSWMGALVDADNRMSLSRVQLFLWTVILLPAIAVIAIARTQTDPLTALDFFVPQTVWLLLGISTTSFLGSPLIKDKQRSAPATNPQLNAVTLETLDPQRSVLVGRKIHNLSIRDASLPTCSPLKPWA